MYIAEAKERGGGRGVGETRTCRDKKRNRDGGGGEGG